VQVRGVELLVRDPGGNAAPFVWGHGLTSSMVHEDELGVFGWSSAPARWIRYDARGHGDSGATAAEEDYRWSNLALDMLGVMDELGIERAVLGGASMGAATALHAAVAAPKRVAGLVLVIPPTAWETRAAQSRLYRAGARTIQAFGVGAVAKAAKLAPQPAIFRDELAAMQGGSLEVWERFDRDVLATILRGAGQSDLPDPSAIRSIDVPSLVLAWDTDAGHPVSTAERLADLLPRATLHVAREPADVLTWPAQVAGFFDR
jgi:pimeloyl-ACP methyl ester carboxylesterase